MSMTVPSGIPVVPSETNLTCQKPTMEASSFLFSRLVANRKEASLAPRSDADRASRLVAEADGPSDGPHCAFALSAEKVASRNTPNTTDSVRIIIFIKFPFLPTMAGRRELCFLTGGNTMHGICRGGKGLVKL